MRQLTRLRLRQMPVVDQLHALPPMDLRYALRMLARSPGFTAAEVLRVRLVSSNYFDLLGVVPRMGRGFQPNDRAAAIVSYACWKQKLGGDPAVLTQAIRTQGTALDIVGVAPEEFAATGLPPEMPDLWIPLAMQPEILPGADWLRDDQAPQWQVLARRARSAGIAQASAELEFAVRFALGAGRLHLVRQLCAESLLLGIAGGVAGLLFSLWACEGIRRWAIQLLGPISGGLSVLHLDLSPDWRVLTYTAAVSAITGMAIGIWPALGASRCDIHQVLKQAAAGPAAARRKRNLLVTAQVAACLILLAGAGLLFRGAWRSGAVAPGFETGHLLLAGINTETATSSPAARAALLRLAADRIRGLPDVVSAAWADRPPFLGHGTAGFYNESGAGVRCLFNAVSDGYFDTIGIPFVAGRNFTREEIETGARVLVINDIAARRAWPGRDPIGRQVHGLNWRKGLQPNDSFTVTGVVKGIRSTFLSKPDEAYLYFPKPPTDEAGVLIVRTRTTPQAAAHSVFAAVGAVNANLPSQTSIASIEQGPLKIQRMMTEAPALAASALGVLALVLASVGIFGLVSQLVAQRTREIAIRVSLGASHRDVVRLVLWQTLRPVIPGAAIGLAGALGISGLLSAMLVAPDMPDLTYGAGAFHAATFVGALVLLTLAVILASLAPLRRATRIAPAEALRNE